MINRHKDLINLRPTLLLVKRISYVYIVLDAMGAQTEIAANEVWIIYKQLHKLSVAFSSIIQ